MSACRTALNHQHQLQFLTLKTYPAPRTSNCFSASNVNTTYHSTAAACLRDDSVFLRISICHFIHDDLVLYILWQSKAIEKVYSTALRSAVQTSLCASVSTAGKRQLAGFPILSQISAAVSVWFQVLLLCCVMFEKLSCFTS